MKNYSMRALILFLTLTIFPCLSLAQESQPKPTPTGSGIGSGSATKPQVYDESVNKPLTITAKPAPKFTELARENGTEGVVVLRVTFSASGQVTNVSVVSGLPDGLTEQAIAAARNLKFEPMTKNGVPVSVVKAVQYNFSMYYRENDKELKKNAVITEKPEAVYPEEFKSFSGVVTVEAVLATDGIVQIIKTLTDLPKIFETKAVEAATKIKFVPAVHKNGKNVNQRTFIEYVFKPQPK